MVAIGEYVQVRPAEILVVEDNPGDVRLMREALRESKIINQLRAVSDGQEAMAFLRKQGRYANAIRPDLILLDLNLPGKDGREVLSEIKADLDLRRIPVVIVTSSKAEEDILRSYNHHANCYITKPLDLEKFIEVIRAIQDFWISIVKLPPK
jgi:chemotaxis family two-component system response regulator Rcp1